MKATELMIGDWVLHPKYNEPVKVIGIYKTSVDVESTDENLHFFIASLDAELLQPIPLTAEIMEKNFPDRRHCVYWYWHDKISTDTENWYELHIEVGTDEGVVRNIRYVHELQHALKLCGIEKDIEL